MTEIRNRSNKTALLIALAWLPAAASAQTGPAAPDAAVKPAAEEESVGSAPKKAGKKKQSAQEEVVVTGSRVRRKDLSTSAPVTMISREQILAGGNLSIGEFLQQLPEQSGGTNTTVNNGGDGSTTISLRSLGSQRTLVLIDGKRHISGVPGGGNLGDPGIDLNSIPAGAVERIEILKDGASAVYGSDAIGGVVNIITRKKLNGTEVSAYTGISQHGDAKVNDISVLSGVTGEKGSFMLGAGYFTQDSMLASTRDWAKTALSYDYAAGETFPGGSSRIPQGRALVNPTKCPPGNQLCIDLGNKFGTSTKQYIYDPGSANTVNGWRPYVGADAYNFQAVNYLITPSQRIQLFANGNYKFADDSARAYFQSTFVNRQSSNQLAPAPLDTGGYGVVLSGSNQYNPFGYDLTDVRRRLTEAGGRSAGQDISTFTLVAGVDGTLPEAAGPLQGWYWDAAFNFGRNLGSFTTNGSLNTQLTGNGLGPSYQDATGVWRCGTPGNPIAGCTPVNLFGAGGITPAMLTALGGYTGVNQGSNQTAALEVNMSGELFQLMADRPAALALGYQFRREYGYYTYNPISVAGNDSDYNGLNTKGSYNVNEGYGELSIPIVNNTPGAEELEVQAAVRVFNYSTFGAGATYKFGGRWKPIRDLTLRGTFSSGFRAPGVTSLYGGNGPNAESATDPCGDTKGNAVLAAQCAQTLKRGGGGQAAVNNLDDNVQIASTSGGNSQLKPEKASIFTLGLVYEPSQVKNLSLTLDFYNISITQNIGFITTPVILSGCYPGTAGSVSNQTYCDLIQRQTNGQIKDVTDVLQNVGETTTTGIDFAARYSMPTDFGRFGISLDSLILLKLDQTQSDGTILKGLNTYDLGVNPQLKMNVGLSYSLEGFSSSLRGRFIGGYHECSDPTGISSGGGLCSVTIINSDTNAPYATHDIGAYMTFDLYLSYLLKSSYGSTTIAGGIRNLFNTDPPGVYDTAASTNSDPSTYDYVGRYMYARLIHNF